MPDTGKNAVMVPPFILNELNDVHTSMVRHWFQSVSHILDLSNSAWHGVTRQQTDALSVYFDTLYRKLQENIHPDIKKEVPVIHGVSVITGGIGGIGTEICKRLSNDGYRSVSTYISAEEEIALDWQRERRKEGFEVDLVECDVTDFDACERLANLIEEKYGAIDILVNCAGITRDATLKKMEPEKWHAVMDTNLDSVFNVTRSFIGGMIKRNYGRIVNISSVNGQRGQFGQTNYSAAKAGMIGFTRSLALELAEQGITVNCVCPGYVHTSMVEQMRQEILDATIEQIPLKRLANPAEIAAAVAFLAHRDSGYITGTEIAVNGGLWLG